MAQKVHAYLINVACERVMTTVELNAHELATIELFATQHLLKLVAVAALRLRNRDEALDSWAQAFDCFTRVIDFDGVQTGKADAARLHMLAIAGEMLSQCRSWSEIDAAAQQNG